MSADVLRHCAFNSGVVGSVATPHYMVRCEGLEFGSDATIATVRIIDDSPLPQFKDFREASSRGPAPFIYVPAVYAARAGSLEFQRYEEVPDLVRYTKPDNNIHEAVLKIAFDPIGKLRPDPFIVDEVRMRVPGVAPFAVRRLAPLSQSQNPLIAAHNWLVEVTPTNVARLFLLLESFAFCGVIVDSYRQRQMLVYVWKLKQLDRKGVSMVKRQKEPAEGEVLVPPRWDEALIAQQFQKLTHRPGMLAAFVDGVRDRFVQGQDDRTTIARIRYLRNKLEECKVGKELQREIDDLSFRETDLEIRGLEQDLKKNDLADRLATQAELRKAEHKRDLLRVKLETQQIEKQMRDLKPQAPPQGIPTRTTRIQELRERIQRAKEERAYARETTSDSDELKRKENLCDDKIARLEEELSSLT